MSSPRRSNQLPYTMQADTPSRYFLATCAGALLVAALFVLWSGIATLNVGSALVGVSIALILFGLAYLLLSTALLTIVLHESLIVLTRWLLKKPEMIPLANVERLEQRSAGPVDLLVIHRRNESRPIHLIDLFPRDDIFFAQTLLERQEPPRAADPDILQRARRFGKKD